MTRTLIINDPDTGTPIEVQIVDVANGETRLLTPADKGPSVFKRLGRNVVAGAKKTVDVTKTVAVTAVVAPVKAVDRQISIHEAKKAFRDSLAETGTLIRMNRKSES